MADNSISAKELITSGQASTQEDSYCHKTPGNVESVASGGVEEDPKLDQLSKVNTSTCASILSYQLHTYSMK